MARSPFSVPALRPRHLSQWALVFSWMLLSKGSRAGNLDAFYLSGDAALQAGAITADAQGGGSVWYNPAGLASLDGLRLDVSVNGYALRFGGSADFDAPSPDSRVVRLTRLDLNVVPTALTVTQRFGSLGIGFGVFVPSQSTAMLRTQVLGDPAQPGVDFGFDAYSRQQDYHVGPAIGFHVADNFRLGVSLLANYRNEITLVDADTTVRLDEAFGSIVATQHTTVDWQQVGMEFVLGAQWDISKDHRLGINVRTPALRVYQVRQWVDNQSLSGRELEPKQTLSSGEEQGLDTRVLTPFRFHLGYSRSFGDTRLALEASCQLPYESDELELRLQPTVNGRAGIRTKLGEKLSIGGGLFSDRSPNEEPEGFGDSRIDYYGISTAIDFGTPYGVYSENGKILERPRTLFFGTTIALSYAVGLGTVMRAEVELDRTDFTAIRPIPADVMAHEFTLHIGSTFAE